MSEPKVILADLHLHNWNQFATVNADGINTRLQILLDEIKRAGAELQKAGGDTMIFAGDVFHVRGSIAPSVFNPVQDTLEELVNMGIRVIIIPGNHDLEGKGSDRVGSAVTSLEKVGCEVLNAVEKIDGDLFVPWHEDIVDLKKTLREWAGKYSDADRATMDVYLHAPIDGVIPGLPAHGLTAEWLGDLGFRRVFSGHYHNHKNLGRGVYSIGALAHHTWSDPGTAAGFLLVTPEEVTWMKSHAPEFVEITGDMDKFEIEMAVDKNYVRAKIGKSKTADVEELRKWLTDSGAIGIVINVIKEPTRARPATATVKAGASIETSIGEYITGLVTIDDDIRSDVTREAIAVLAEVE